MASSNRAMRTALAVLLGFACLTWILSLIGLAGLQRNCYSLPTGTWLTSSTAVGQEMNLGLPHTGIRGFNRSLGCDAIYRYYWWTFAFEAICLIGLAVMAAVGLLAASALSWMAWLSILTVMYFQGTDSFLALQDLAYNARQLDYGTYVFARLTSAGWILTAIANMGLTFLLGWRAGKKDAAASGPMKY
eukprot:gene9758-9915_t